MPKTFAFPVWLEGTPEEQAAEDERQKLALAIHGRGHLSEAERLVGRGRLLEQTARQNVEDATNQNHEARVLAENQLADSLAMQGRFREASVTHHERHRRKHFREIGRAIEMNDAAKCVCSDRHAEMNGVRLAITPRFEEARVFSVVHNQIVSVVRCSKCGHRNARPLRSRLLKHNAAQNKAEKLGQPAESDAQVLIDGDT